MAVNKHSIILLTTIFVNCIAYSQNSMNNKTINPETIINETYTNLMNPDTTMPRLSTSNYVETLFPLIERYANEPLYYIYIRNEMCTYQLLINDMMEYSSFKYEKIITPLLLNTSILKSGKQKLTLRIYPIGKLGDIEYNTFPDFASLGLTLYCRNYQTGFTEEKVVIDYQSPIKKNDQKRDVFIAAGENYYEINLEFKAQVPYVHKGWSEGQDLRLMDQEKLEKEVVQFFHKQWIIYKERDLEASYSYLYQKELEVTASTYHSKDDLIERVEEDNALLAFKEFEIQPMDNYIMKFYGYGRVVSLRLINEIPTYKDESAIYAKYRNDKGRSRILFNDFYIYLPKGRELKAENFVIIR